MGGNGKDILNGGGGNDTINGGNGKDTIFGDAGDDTLLGGNGNDVIDPGAGEDIMTGGAGSELFVFDFDGALDTVTDFDDGTDQISLDGLPSKISALRTTRTEMLSSAMRLRLRCFSPAWMRHSSPPMTSFPVRDVTVRLG